MGAKRKPVNPARWRNNQVGSKLINKPISQPFTVPGTLMEEISGHSRGRSYTGELKPTRSLEGQVEISLGRTLRQRGSGKCHRQSE